jgi:hypothetical protein
MVSTGRWPQDAVNISEPHGSRLMRFDAARLGAACSAEALRTSNRHPLPPRFRRSLRQRERRRNTEVVSFPFSRRTRGCDAGRHRGILTQDFADYDALALQAMDRRTDHATGGPPLTAGAACCAVGISACPISLGSARAISTAPAGRGKYAWRYIYCHRAILVFA